MRENRHLGMLFLRAPPSTIPDRDIDTVAFAVVETAVYESAQSVSLQIHRRGPCRNAIYVEWKTENLPLANGGVMSASYRDQGGSFEFQPEQEIATIQIAVEENDDWNLEARQWVFITKLESLGDVDVELGELERTSLVILNNDAFPGGLDPEVCQSNSNRDIRCRNCCSINCSTINIYIGHILAIEIDCSRRCKSSYFRSC